jgi:YfiH family protein
MKKIQCDQFFENTHDLICFPSTSNYGNMKDKKIRRKFLSKLCPENFLATVAENVHSGEVGLVTNGSGGVFLGVDGLITNESRRLIGVTFADCYPVIYCDFKNEAIGIAHCSYKSLKAQLCRNVMRKMISLLGADASVTEIYIGPGICQGHYEFGKEAPVLFADYAGSFSLNEEGNYQVNLVEIIKQQLIKEGIREENIEKSGICTFEDKRYYSARRDRKDPSDPIEACIFYVGLR